MIATPAPTLHDAQAAFNSWFEGSQVIGSLGIPQPVYHGTDCCFEKFELSEDIGFHFGSAAAASARIEQAEMEEGRLVAVYLSMKNPLLMPDLLTWSPRAVARSLQDLEIITAQECDETDLVDREQVAEWLGAKGHDGIVYENVTEGGGLSYIALHADQIRNAFAWRAAASEYKMLIPPDGHIAHDVTLPGGVHANITANEAVVSIYEWSSNSPGHGNTRAALRHLRAGGRAIEVHDPGDPGTESRHYWEKMANEGLVDRLFDELGDGISRQSGQAADKRVTAAHNAIVWIEAQTNQKGNAPHA